MPAFCDGIASFGSWESQISWCDTQISHNIITNLHEQSCVGFACGSFLWGLQNWLLCGHRDPSHLSKEQICLCVSIALCFTWTLLHFCCNAVDHLGWTMWIHVLWRKQGLKMHFLNLAAIRIPRSLLFVVCGHICFYVYVGCPKGIFFCWSERSDEMIFNFFFLLHCLLTTLNRARCQM